ncbi:phosphotransferase family protein [Parafrankia elaeagni]|uniref:phosphotransferase family protein n=1 Tax=Parafrankia elaeagni TaxID=222534 RepID=UPI000367F75F|nr:phosphotransferase family protein [Parafrankia elaeagni]
MDVHETAPAPLGIAVQEVDRWFGEHVTGAVPPLSYGRVTGGHSCLTYIATDADGTRFVLRRPPVGALLATAHDVTREARIMAALADTDVPLPRVLGVCDDPEVTGAHFYVMSHVDGLVVRDAANADQLLPSPAARRRAGYALVDALAALHAIDIDAVGLGTLARREGYLDRQLRRWSAQWDACGLGDLGGITRLHDWLVANRPADSAPRIVHGDYRLGNALLGPDGELHAILDWELCTLGDPLADVAYLLRTWSATDARTGGEQLPSALDGFASTDELATRYAERSGQPVGQLDYWLAFTAWRAAGILAGVYRRYADGKMGDPPDDLPSFLVEVEARVQQGRGFAGLS